MKAKRFYLLLPVLFFTSRLFGQIVLLDYIEEPFNEILLDLNERYEVQVSINSELSANCLVTIRQEFKSLDNAMDVLAEKCQLTLTRINDVYSFRSDLITEAIAVDLTETKKGDTHVVFGALSR